jgi:hypothetical protein
VLLLDRRTFDPSRRLHRHGRAVSLATTFCEHNPMLYDMARRANECVVLNATDSNRLVRDHVGQDQLSPNDRMLFFEFDPSVIAVAVAAVLGGIVAAGSNRSTAIEAMHELTAAEAKRAALIGQIDLRLVPDRDG